MKIDEELDIYDSTGQLLGITKTKDKVHRDGDWHKTFHCWIIYKDPSGNDIIVVQKRANQKKNWPDKLDITAAGHIIAGEGIEGGLREIREELGLNVTVDKLIPVGLRVCVEDFQAGLINREFQDVFFHINDTSIFKYSLQADEVYGLISMKVDDALKLFSTEIDTVKADGFILNEGVVTSQDFIIRKEDFIPTLDNYYFKIMILAKRILAKEKYLII